MRTEVEIKAWVDDVDALRERVAARYPHGGSFVKEDVYYRLGGGPAATAANGATGSAPGDPGVEFRLRIESGEAIVTAKRKSIVDGLEVNDEMEYTVSDPTAFERFASYLGASPFCRKRKTGDRYRAGSATIELSHVDRLGDFIEIERLLEGDDPSLISAADREVRGLLAELGIPTSRVEPRYYIDLLASLEGE